MVGALLFTSCRGFLVYSGFHLHVKEESTTGDTGITGMANGFYPVIPVSPVVDSSSILIRKLL